VSTTPLSALGGRSLACAVSRRLREPRAALLLGVIVVLVDLTILLAGWIYDRPTPTSLTLLAWIVLVTGASLVPLTSGADKPVLSMDLPILLGAAFALGPIVAATIGFLGCIDLRDFRRELSLTRGLFDRAQVSLSVFTAGVVFQTFGGHLGRWPTVAVAGLAALVADGFVNYALVAAMTSLRMHSPIRHVVSAMRFGPAEVFVPTYACFGFIGLLLAEAYQSHGLWGVFSFAAPIVLGRQAFLHRHSFEMASRLLLTKGRALEKVDERIAEERRDERARIAEALHDEVLQVLYNVSLRTHVIREDLRGGRLLDLDDDVPALLSASERAIDELRDVIRDLRRSPIGRAGLADTLSLLVNHLQDEFGIHVLARIESVNVQPSTQLLIYQVAREALLNAMKYSGASAVSLNLVQTGEVVEMTMEDNGKGFDLSNVDPRHFGLALMRERVSAAAGELSIRSHPGEGTHINARFPAL
jgi:signal transduction histidine kinase